MPPATPAACCTPSHTVEEEPRARLWLLAFYPLPIEKMTQENNKSPAPLAGSLVRSTAPKVARQLPGIGMSRKSFVPLTGFALGERREGASAFAWSGAVHGVLLGTGHKAAGLGVRQVRRARGAGDEQEMEEEEEAKQP